MINIDITKFYTKESINKKTENILKVLFENKYNKMSKTLLARKLKMNVSNLHVFLDILTEKGLLLINRQNTNEGTVMYVSINEKGEENYKLTGG